MKVKYLVLMAMCTALCALGCACEKAQPSGGDSTPTPPSASDEIPEEKPGAPIVSVSQSSVVLCVGESFTLTASAEEIENPVFSWVIDGGAEGDVVALSQTGNTAVITALKIGTTKLVASVKQDGNVFFKTVEITVKEESGVSLVVGNNIGFDNNGYCVQLSTLSTAELDTSIVPLVSVYKNNKLISGVAFSWQSENTDVVKVEDKKLVSMGEGSAYVVGSCVVEEKTYNVRILVEVSRPTIALNESFVVETENLAPLQITSTLGGIAQDVLYGGVSVGEYDMQKKTVRNGPKKLVLPTRRFGTDISSWAAILPITHSSARKLPISIPCGRLSKGIGLTAACMGLEGYLTARAITWKGFLSTTALRLAVSSAYYISTVW